MTGSDDGGALETLRKVGFELAGRWLLDSGALQFALDRCADRRNVLYAFVSAKSLLYVGKTTMTLTHRMRQYARPGPSQHTNLRNNAAIRELLEQGRVVEIHAFCDDGAFMYSGIQVNLAAGLEVGLIDQLQPPWNGTGKRDS